MVFFGAESSYYKIVQDNLPASILISSVCSIAEGALVLLIGRLLTGETKQKIARIIGYGLMIATLVGDSILLITGGRI